MLPHNLRSRSLLRPRKIFMIVVDVDAKISAAKFRCPDCRHDGGWMSGLTATEKKRQPCPHCNAQHANPIMRAR